MLKKITDITSNHLSSYFAASRAFFIAVEEYESLTPLQTPVNDVRLLADILQLEAHDFDIHPLIFNPGKSELEDFLSCTLPALVQPDDRVLLYFAGHGIALDGEEIAAPKGYLLPRNAQRNDETSFISMDFLNKHLDKLPCRHLLLLLDCCFAGAFQWSNAMSRDLAGFDHLPKHIYQQRFEYFVQEPAWQVITSAAYNQKAADLASQHPLGMREEGHQSNSPFALALAEALRDGAGDLVPPEGDGLMTLSEIFSYVQGRLAQWQSANTQKPACFPLPKHKQGEFLFLNPAKKLFLTAYNDENNPYRGLQSYEPENRNSFYGRERVIAALRDRIASTNLLVISGHSGAGKSSVVKAGLLPALVDEGYIYTVIRPGVNPVDSLKKGLAAIQSIQFDENLAKPAVLVVDQFEETITQCVNKEEREGFYRQLLDLYPGTGPVQKVIVTVRADFEPVFDQTILREIWHPARYIIPTLNFTELQEIVIQPASERCLQFDTGLVDELVKSVLNMPGGLPLLSFTLAELYDGFVKRWASGDTRRTLTWTDYREIGGVEGSLRQKADMLYAGFDDAKKSTMQNLLLRMVAITGGEYAGKRVMKRDLVFDDPLENERMSFVVQTLGEARLVVSGKSDATDVTYVEPAHDALVRAWPELLGWITNRGAETVVLQNRLIEAVNDHEFANGGLWNKDPRLDFLRTELDKSNSWLNQRERKFIRESVSEAIRELEELKKERDEAIRQRNVAEKNMRAATNTALVLRTVKTDPTLALRIADYNLRRHPENAAGYSLFHDIISDTGQVFYRQTLKAGHAAAHIFAVAFSPDGKTMLTGSWDKKARLWSHKGQLIHTLEGHGGTVNAVAYSPDGKLLLTGSADHTAKIWSPNGQLLRTLSEHQKGVTAVAFSPDGKWILTGSNDNTAKIWSLEGHVLITLTGHDDMVNAVACSPDGKTILTGSDDRTAKLWSPEGQVLVSLGEHEGHVSSVAFSPDGKTILTGSGDRSAKLWSLDGSLLHTFNAHRDVVKSVAFSPDGKTILTGSQDWTAKVWTPEGQLIATLTGHQSSVESAVFSPDYPADPVKGKMALTGSLDSMTKCWSLAGLLLSNFEGHSGSLSAVAISPDGTKVLTGSHDKTAKIWTTGGKLISTLTGEQGAVYACVFSPDGNWILTGNQDKTAIIWSDEGKPVVIFSGHADRVTSVAFSPDGKQILTGSRDKTARLWSLDGQVIATLKGHEGPVWSVAFSPDGSSILTGGDKTVKIWSTNGDLLYTFTGHSNVVLATAFSPDGKTILSGSSDDTAIHWSLDGQVLAILKGHEIGVNAVAFSPDGKTLGTASNDDTAKLWSPEGQLLTTLTGHKGYVNAITFSPDGKTILTASADKTAKCWMLPQTFLAERVQKFSLQEFHDAGVQLEPDDLAQIQPLGKAT